MSQSRITDRCHLCESEDGVDHFCTNCEKILCLYCKEIHSKSGKTRLDKIISLSLARHDDLVHQSTAVFCDEHSSVEITLFCFKCDQVVCVQCMSGKHKRHEATTIDDIRDSKAKELENIIKTLKEKKAVYDNAFDIQGQAYSRFSKSVDKVEEDIVSQKAKIIEELNTVCDQQFAELKKLRQNEEKIYSDARNQIQAQNQAVTSSIQTAEKSLANNNAALIVQSTVAATKTLQRIEEPSMPPTKEATYQIGDRSGPAINNIQGKINVKRISATYQESTKCHPTTAQVQSDEDTQLCVKPKVMPSKVKLPGQKTIGDNKPQTNEDSKPRIDRSRVRIKSTLKIKGKSTIYIIVPLLNKTAWVHADNNRYLTLINSRGKIVTMSVLLGDDVHDAKLYRNGLLVTCSDQCKLYSLALHGKSIFCDLSPYYTNGLSVTQASDVMVCLQSSTGDKDNKVVRLNTAGAIMQTIQHDVTGAPLYNNPYKVTVLPTGEVIVKDGDKIIVGVDREGKHLFTWKGEIQGKKLDEYSLGCITHDSNNNLFVTDGYDRVLVLGKDGSGAMCLLDSTQGIVEPWGVAVDNAGKLWVGCSRGNVHIIKY